MCVKTYIKRCRFVFCVFFFLITQYDNVLLKKFKIDTPKRHRTTFDLNWKYFSLFVSVRFGSTRCVHCVFDVLTAPTSELRSHSHRRHWLCRSVPMAVREGRCQLVLSAPVIVCTPLLTTIVYAVMDEYFFPLMLYILCEFV